MALSAAIYFLAAFAVPYIRATEVIPCETGAAPTALRVVGCPNQPCTFPRGSVQSVEVDFHAATDSQTLTIQILSTSAGITTVYPVPDSNACPNLTTGNCPLTAREALVYSTMMPIQETYPPGPVRNEVTLRGDASSVQTCFIINAIIV